jgi:hypothetical protein
MKHVNIFYGRLFCLFYVHLINKFPVLVYSAKKNLTTLYVNTNDPTYIVHAYMYETC